MHSHYHFVIAGAGLAGLVLSERLSAAGFRCLVLERRSHFGGNCQDKKDKNGLLYHAYGPHYFRTNSTEVRDYLSRFTEWRETVYKVQVAAEGRQWSFPVNLKTFQQYTNVHDATEAQFIEYLNQNRVAISSPTNSEEAMLASVGPAFYNLFFRGYTQKQWGRSASQLDASVCRRIPVRTTTDERYFQESFQALPKNGYSAMFENIIDSAPMDLQLGVDYRDVLPSLKHDHLIYTGPLDEYFDCRWGRLPYRSLRFQLEELSMGNNASAFAQPVLQINYPGTEPFTRTVEVKHITGQQSRHTNIVREFPQEYKAGENEPYYPVPSLESQMLADRYRAMATREQNVTFIGRLATYRYLNMDQVVGAALHAADKLVAKFGVPATR